MFNEILDKLNRSTSIRERLVALKETKSWEQVALALYSIPESSETFRNSVMCRQASKHNCQGVKTGLSESMAEYARKELELAGMFDEDSDYEGMIGEAVIELIELFASQGHSGCSADITRSIFDRLAKFKPMTELTDNPTEWMKIEEEHLAPSEHNLYQSRRSPTCFSYDGGKTYYDLDEMQNNVRVPGTKPMHQSVKFEAKPHQHRTPRGLAAKDYAGVKR